VICHLLSAL